MRIVVSGTHASGKSTLIADFAQRHPEFTALPDPFELLDEEWDAPGAGMFVAQLRIAAERLRSDEFASPVIAERGPLDFLAYLLALQELDRETAADELIERARAITADAMSAVDLLVVLPLTGSGGIVAGADEHLELRDLMNDLLLELIDDAELIGPRARVVEIVGSRSERLARLEASVVDSA